MVKSNWIWAFLGLLALGLRLLAGFFPDLTDQVYSRSIFPIIRIGIDYSLGSLPFPTAYLFFGLIFWLFGLVLRRFFRVKGVKNRWKYLMQTAANGLGALIFLFLLLWGYNYQRTPIIERLSLQPKPLSLSQLTEEINRSQHLAVLSRGQITQDTMALSEVMDYAAMESEVRATLAQNSGVLALNFAGRPRTKQFPPQGMMRRMGILGIYFPFTGESYLDPALHVLEKPFTIAHEMAHSLGVTNEGEASFIAWVVCTRAENPVLQYAAYLVLLRYQLRDYFEMDPDGALCWMETLPRGIIQDLISIREAGEAYPPIWLALSRASNDLFLKSQGVKAGIQSYQQLPMLAFAWHKKIAKNGEGVNFE